MLPIRQNLLTISWLKSAAKTMLIEVCELAENGGQGACFASNATLARNLGISAATVVRKIAELEAARLLTSMVVKAEGNRRYLRPTAAVRACYAGSNKAEHITALCNLTIVKNAILTPLTIAKTNDDYSQNKELTIVKTDSDYSQNASRVFGDDQDDQLDDQDKQRAWASERAALQKKIIELESENAQLKAKFWEPAPLTAISSPVVLPAICASEAKMLANTIGQFWKISEVSNYAKWSRIAAFTKRLAELGRLDEVSKQFAGYRLQRGKAGIGPHNLDTWLGKYSQDFADGEWCGRDWAAVAADTRSRPNSDSFPAATVGTTSYNPSDIQRKNNTLAT